MIITSRKHLTKENKQSFSLVCVNMDFDSFPPDESLYLNQFTESLNQCRSMHGLVEILKKYKMISVNEDSKLKTTIQTKMHLAIGKLVKKKLNLNECLRISLSKWISESNNLNINEQLCSLIDSPAVTAQHLKCLSEKGLLVNNDKRLLQPNIIAEMSPGFVRQQFASQTLQAAMLRSIASDNPKAVNSLLLSGLPLHREKGFQLPWLHTCAFNNSVNVTKLLIRWGVDVNTLDSSGIAPIHIAARENHSLMLDILLHQPHLNLNAQDTNGNSAVIIAANNDSWECLELLMNCDKTDINIENNAGKNLLSYLLFSNQETILSKAINHLDICLKSQHLINSIHRDNRYAVNEILNREPDLLKTCESEALVVTVSHGHTDILRNLIDLQANINLQDSRGCTPLHIACEYSHPEIIKIILSCPEIDLSLLDYKSQNVLSIANLAAESAQAQINNSIEISPQKSQRLRNAKMVLTLLNDYLKSMYL